MRVCGQSNTAATGSRCTDRVISSTERETLIWNGVFQLIKHAQHSKHKTSQKKDSRVTEGTEILCRTKSCGVSNAREKTGLLPAHTIGEQMEATEANCGVYKQ